MPRVLIRFHLSSGNDSGGLSRLPSSRNGLSRALFYHCVILDHFVGVVGLANLQTISRHILSVNPVC